MDSSAKRDADLAAWLGSQPGGAVSFRDYMRWALYDPAHGYYLADRRRVGRDGGSDFYTATSLGSVFGTLVAACCESFIEDPGSWHFVELGAEAGGGVLEGVETRFASCTRIGVDRAGHLAEDLGQLAGKGRLVVFSNELFDAQPVERWVKTAEGWREAGVAPGRDGLRWVLLETPAPGWLDQDPLAAQAPEGYLLDAPRASAELLGQLAASPWEGLFVAFDYGLSWSQLATERNQGTLRAYSRHRLSGDPLQAPGEVDLTAHVCWDWLIDGLGRQGFRGVEVLSQEAFLVRRAGPALSRLLADGARSRAISGRIRELLHPSGFGQRFQVLSGLRGTG